MKKYYLNKETMWQYETQEEYKTIEELIEADELLGPVEDVVRKEGLNTEEEIIILVSANIGWNYVAEYQLVNPTVLKRDYLEISEEAYEFFIEVKEDNDLSEEIIEMYIDSKKYSVEQN